MEALLARGDYGRFFAPDMQFAVMGTDQQTRGAEAAEQAIRFLHETAFDVRPDIVNLVVDEHGAAAEAVFVGTYTGEFAGMNASGSAVRVPYSVFYEVEGDRITALRIYMPMDQLVAQVRDATQARVANPHPDGGQGPAADGGSTSCEEPVGHIVLGRLAGEPRRGLRAQ
jgi:predicted ester cyclase